MITTIKDIDLINDTDNYDVILVGTNTYLTLSNGFQRKIKFKYPEANELNMSTKYGDSNKMGTIKYDISKKPIICFCYISKGYNFRPDIPNSYVDYDALEKCIKTVNLELTGKKVATTILGTSRFDGNGNRDVIIKILENNNENIDLYVYDYHQYSVKEEADNEFNRTIHSQEFNKYDPKQWDDMNERLRLIRNPDGVRRQGFDKMLQQIKAEVKTILKNEKNRTD